LNGKARTREVNLTTQGKILVIVAILLYAQGYALNNLVPSLLASLLLGYLAFARFSYDDQLRTTALSATRHGKRRAFQDRPFRSSLEIYNSSSNATLVDIEDDLPDELELVSGNHRMRTVIEPDSSAELSYTLRPITRGELELEEFRMELMDERGLMSTLVVDGEEMTVDVQPPIEKFKKGEILLKRERMAGSGTARSDRPGRGYEFAGLRQYVGDDASSSIEWKASSRLARLMTKLMYDETRGSVYILLDCSRSMRLKPEPEEVSKLDQSVYHAVQMASQLSKRGFPVAMATYDEHRVLDYEPPSAGRSRPSELMHTLSKIPRSGITQTRPRGYTNTGKNVDVESPLIARVLPFFGRRTVGSSEEAAGIYAAVERLVQDGAKSGVVVVYSDLKTNPKSMQLASKIILRRGHLLIVITPLSSIFEVQEGEMTVEVLEDLYLEYQSKRSLMRRLERMGAQVIEVEKGKEAALTLSKRLERG